MLYYYIDSIVLKKNDNMGHILDDNGIQKDCASSQHSVRDLLSTPLHNDIAALKKSIKGHLKVSLIILQISWSSSWRHSGILFVGSITCL